MTPERLTPLDAPLLSALHDAAMPPGWSAAAFAALLRLPTTVGLRAADGAGFILLGLAGDAAEVLMLAVHPDAQRRGLGRALLEAGAALSAEIGAARMVLEVADGNVGARALYAAAGFGQIGRRKAYYESGAAAGQDALVLERPIRKAG